MKFDALLKVRLAHQQLMQTMHAKQQLTCETLEKKRKQLKAQIFDVHQELVQDAPASVHKWHAHEYLRLKEEMSKIEQLLLVEQKKCEQSRALLEKAFFERKVVEKIRAKSYNSWLAQESKLDAH